MYKWPGGVEGGRLLVAIYSNIVFCNFRCLGPLFSRFHSFGVQGVFLFRTLQMYSISGVMVHFKGS